MHRHISVRRPISGQSLLLMALCAVAIFAVMGFAIDGGLLYTQRRLMQNTSDAACLAAANRLALNQASQATTAAQQVIQTNLGATPGTGINAPGSLAYTTVSDVYSPSAGTGTGLTKGIEINGSDVRVALQSPANAFFMQILGYNTYTVAARSHCDAKAAGGGVPFAVARWRGYDSTDDVDSDGLTTNRELPQYYTHGAHSDPMTVRDLLAQESSSVITQWPDWGQPDYPGDPAAGTGLYSDPSPAATESAPGRETYIAGNQASPNVGDPSFTGPIVLDFRQTTFPSPLFYNGLTPGTALNQYKDFATSYILGTYPGPLVIPGQEIAYYNGVSAGQITKPFDQRYDKNQIVTVLMYNGTINSDPDFSVTFPSAGDRVFTRATNSFSSGTCSVPAGEAFDGKASPQTDRNPDATYRINVLPQTYSTFKLRAFISSDDPDQWEGNWSSSSTPTLSSGQLTFNINGSAPVVSINTAGRDVKFDSRPTRTFSCTDPLTGTTTDYPSRKDGLQTIYLEVQDTATGKRRGVYVKLAQGNTSGDFYAYFSATPIAYQPLEPGNSTSAELKLETASGSSLDIGPGGTDVHPGAIEWYDPGNLSSSLHTGTTYNGVTLDVSKQGARNQLSISASNSATTSREYYIRIPLTYGTKTHYVWYYIAVRPPLSNASGISQFVYALGYARFKITDIGSNYIKGRAVSGLLRTQAQIISGFQPRLLAW